MCDGAVGVDRQVTRSLGRDQRGAPPIQMDREVEWAGEGGGREAGEKAEAKRTEWQARVWLTGH